MAGVVVEDGEVEDEEVEVEAQEMQIDDAKKEEEVKTEIKTEDANEGPDSKRPRISAPAQSMPEELPVGTQVRVWFDQDGKGAATLARTACRCRGEPTKHAAAAENLQSLQEGSRILSHATRR